jgi:iron complex transport system ATP-binding protein
MALLEFNQVSFGYSPDAILFHDLTWMINRGEMVGLIGPNGAGKTSLLRLASGTMAPLAGKIIFDKRNLRSLGRREIARSIAVVPQELTMPFAFTVRHMIEMGRTPHLSSLSWGALSHNDRNAVDHAIAMTGTEKLADRIFNELSGGEQQKVLIAMALAQEPELLLLDEPTAHLDVRHQIEVLDLVAQLNKEKSLTVLAILHDLNLAARYFPRLLLFQQGIVADGPPSTILIPTMLEEVYGVKVHVGILRGAKYLSMMLPGSESLESTSTLHLPKVHVIAGGGTGDLVMRALAEADILFSAGALNIGDSDASLAEQLAVTTITERPFSPISPEAQNATIEAMYSAGTIVICPIPLGPGNVALIDAACIALESGVHVLLFEPTYPCPTGFETPDDITRSIAMRDYANGAGQAAYHTLSEKGAQMVTNLTELITVLSELCSSDSLQLSPE